MEIDTSMRPIEYYPLSISKKNDQIWLILQGDIVISVVCFCGQNGIRTLSKGHLAKVTLSGLC